MGRRNGTKYRTKGCISIFLPLLILFAIIGKMTQDEEKKETNQTTTQSSVVESSDGEEVGEAIDYNVADINVKIQESFEDSVRLNNESNDGYEWVVFVTSIVMQDNGVVYVDVTPNFSELKDEEKTFVLNKVNSTVNVVVFLETEKEKTYYISAFDINGNRIAHSKAFDLLSYKFK